MQELEFILEDEFIELIKLLKHLHVSESGGQAKMMVDDGVIELNGEVEYRKRAKLIKGDVVVAFEEVRITII